MILEAPLSAAVPLAAPLQWVLLLALLDLHSTAVVPYSVTILAPTSDADPTQIAWPEASGLLALVVLVTKVIRTLDVVAPSVSVSFNSPEKYYITNCIMMKFGSIQQKTLNAQAIRSAITSVASIHARLLAALTLNVPFAITSPFASAPRDSPVIHSFLALHHPAPVSSADRVWIKNFFYPRSLFLIFKFPIIGK